MYRQYWGFMAIRGIQQGPFFKLANGQPHTKSIFTTRIRGALQAVGLSESQFAGHSLRIGAATAAASAGIEDSMIRTPGRWSSSAFLLYIRTPRQHLAGFSRAFTARQ